MNQANPAANPFALDRSIKPDNTYIERLVKIIPVEVTGLYIFLSSMGSETDFEDFLGIILILLIIILLFLYLPRMQNVTAWSERIVITISFVIWAATFDVNLMQHYAAELGAPPGLTKYFAPQPVGMILALWTFALPTFYKKAAV